MGPNYEMKTTLQTVVIEFEPKWLRMNPFQTEFGCRGGVTETLNHDEMRVTWFALDFFHFATTAFQNNQSYN